jgi:hypothetical protein
VPSILHEATLDDIDEALAYARATRTARKACGLDTSASDQWIDTLLDMRSALTN